MTTPPSPEVSRAAALLETVKDPASGQGLMTSGRVQGLTVVDRRVSCVIEAPRAEVARYGPVRDAAEQALKGLERSR